MACGRHVVIATACDSGYDSARELVAAGVNVVAIVDHRLASGCETPQGVPVYRGSAIVAVQGRRSVEGVTIASHDGRQVHTLQADCVGSAGGWTPAVHL